MRKKKEAKTKAMKIVLALDFSICAMFRLVFVLWASKRKKKIKENSSNLVALTFKFFVGILVLSFSLASTQSNSSSLQLYVFLSFGYFRFQFFYRHALYLHICSCVIELHHLNIRVHHWYIFKSNSITTYNMFKLNHMCVI